MVEARIAPRYRISTIKAENRENMYLDQDRQNVTGSPALADTITRARRARSRRTSVGTRCSRTTAFRAIEAGAWIPLPLAARLGFRLFHARPITALSFRAIKRRS